MADGATNLELTPAQPREILQAVAAALVQGPRDVDPWWQAGLEEQLQQ